MYKLIKEEGYFSPISVVNTDRNSSITLGSLQSKLMSDAFGVKLRDWKEDEERGKYLIAKIQTSEKPKIVYAIDKWDIEISEDFAKDVIKKLCPIS